jgi:hypothetical protein
LDMPTMYCISSILYLYSYSVIFIFR